MEAFIDAETRLLKNIRLNSPSRVLHEDSVSFSDNFDGALCPCSYCP
jgi:hypothetical protein